MTRILLISLISLVTFNSCFISSATTSQQDMIRNCRVCDASYIGLLNFCRFEGAVENKNYFAVNNVKLKAHVYDPNAKTFTYHEFKIGIPISSNGKATYSDKIYLGKGLEIKRVEVISAQRY